MKKALFAIALVLGLALNQTKAVMAEEQNCVSVYGGGVVCGAKTPEVVHEPKETGLVENIAFLGVSLIVSSGVLKLVSRKITPDLA